MSSEHSELLPHYCALHAVPLVRTPQKSNLLGKCLWRDCSYGLLASDPNGAIQDIAEWNFTDDRKPAETL